MLCKRKEIPLLGKAVPYSWWRIPILPGPLLEVNCLLSPLPSLTPAPAFQPTGHLFTHRQHYHTPLLLVGHSPAAGWKQLPFCSLHMLGELRLLHGDCKSNGFPSPSPETGTTNCLNSGQIFLLMVDLHFPLHSCFEVWYAQVFSFFFKLFIHSIHVLVLFGFGYLLIPKMILFFLAILLGCSLPLCSDSLQDIRAILLIWVLSEHIRFWFILILFLSLQIMLLTVKGFSSCLCGSQVKKELFVTTPSSRINTHTCSLIMWFIFNLQRKIGISHTQYKRTRNGTDLTLKAGTY